MAGVAGAAVAGRGRWTVAAAEEGGGGHDVAEAEEGASVPILTERLPPAVADRARAAVVELGVALVEGLVTDLVGVEAVVKAARGCWALVRFSLSVANRAVAGRLCGAQGERVVGAEASFDTSARVALDGLSRSQKSSTTRI